MLRSNAIRTLNDLNGTYVAKTKQKGTTLHYKKNIYKHVSAFGLHVGRHSVQSLLKHFYHQGKSQIVGIAGTLAV